MVCREEPCIIQRCLRMYCTLAMQDSFKLLILDVDETPADNSRRGSPNYWESQRIRGIVTERRNTPHNQSHRHHVARTGNDQTVAAASEHMPRMSPNIHLSRQTAPAAVGRRRNRWYVYTYLQLRSEEQMNR